MTSPGFADVTTTSSVLDINTATNEMTVAGLIRGDTICLRTGIYDSTPLLQGAHIGWNSVIGEGAVDFVNKWGGGTHRGFNFYNSSGSGSEFSTGKNLLASVRPGLTVLPTDVFVANNVSTTTAAGGYRLYIRQLAQPMTWSTSIVITAQNSGLFTSDVTLTDAPFITSSASTMVWACNGDPGANGDLFVYSAHLMNSSNTSVANNAQPAKVRLVCRCTNTAAARVNIFIMFYPI